MGWLILQLLAVNRGWTSGEKLTDRRQHFHSVVTGFSPESLLNLPRV